MAFKSAVDDQFGGYALSLSEKLAVRGSLTRIALDENFAQVRFWGKIMGTAKDYLIACATVTTAAITKHYYFSNDGGVKFAKLPAVDAFITERATVAKGMFSGNPENLYRDPGAGEPEEEEEEEEEEDEMDDDYDPDDPDQPPRIKKPKERKFYELDRLVFTVAAIDTDTCITPVGLQYLTATRQIFQNRNFNGLSIAQASQLSSYLLYRNPESENTLARVRKFGVANNADFLDRCQEGLPDRIWKVQHDSSGVNFTLRNMIWSGYEFHLQAHSAGAFCGAYFGYGQRNDDVLFML
jgi:radial spoke head protein 9